MLLAVGGVASAWCAYQASRWSSEQTASLARASKARLESAAQGGLANQLTQLDVATFLAWAEAYASEQAPLADFLRARFRPEFRPVFEEWVASRPLKNPEARETPFALESYRLAARERSLELAADSERLAQAAQYADAMSSRYVRATLVLALGLFFAGISQHFRSGRARVTALGVAAGVLLLGLVGLGLMLPHVLW